MKAITILNRCRNSENDMRRILQKIRQRQEAAEGVTPVMDTVGKQGHGTGEPDRIAVFACDITELEVAYEARSKARCAEAAAICLFLDTLSEVESAILYSYYVNRKKVSEIASSMNYTDPYIRSVKSTAQKKLDDIDATTVREALPPWYWETWPETTAEKGGRA